MSRLISTLILFLLATFLPFIKVYSQVHCTVVGRDSICDFNDKATKPYYRAIYVHDSVTNSYYLHRAYSQIDSIQTQVFEFHPNGVLAKSEVHADGQIVGNRFTYQENGRVSSIILSGTDPSQHDIVLSFHDNGTIGEVERYFDNQIIGTYEIYHSNGRLNKRENYKLRYYPFLGKIPERYKSHPAFLSRKASNWLSFKEGEWLIWDENGVLVSRENYFDGLLVD
jgi:antitoxin component YwqK of YwqJK toxin-antitoxin module